MLDKKEDLYSDKSIAPNISCSVYKKTIGEKEFKFIAIVPSGAKNDQYSSRVKTFIKNCMGNENVRQFIENLGYHVSVIENIDDELLDFIQQITVRGINETSYNNSSKFLDGYFCSEPVVYVETEKLFRQTIYPVTLLGTAHFRIEMEVIDKSTKNNSPKLKAFDPQRSCVDRCQQVSDCYQGTKNPDDPRRESESAHLNVSKHADNSINNYSALIRKNDLSDLLFDFQAYNNQDQKDLIIQLTNSIKSPIS